MSKARSRSDQPACLCPELRSKLQLSPAAVDCRRSTAWLCLELSGCGRQTQSGWLRSHVLGWTPSLAAPAARQLPSPCWHTLVFNCMMQSWSCGSQHRRIQPSMEPLPAPVRATRGRFHPVPSCDFVLSAPLRHPAPRSLQRAADAAVSTEKSWLADYKADLCDILPAPRHAICDGM